MSLKAENFNDEISFGDATTISDTSSFNDDISFGDATTISGTTNDTSHFTKLDIKAKPLEVIRNKWKLKKSVQKARADVFDVIYGTGAHLKALIFLNHYKIPKKYSGVVSSNEDESMTSGSDINDEITSSSDDGYGFNSAICFTENSNFNGEIKMGVCNMEVAWDETNNFDPMIDILIITAEDEDLPLPSP